MRAEKGPQGHVSYQIVQIWANAHFGSDFSTLPRLTDMDISATPKISGERGFLPWRLFIGTMQDSSSDSGSKVYAYVTGKKKEMVVFKLNDQQISKRRMDLINFNAPFCDVNTDPLTAVGRQRMDNVIRWYFISFLSSKGRDSIIYLDREFWFSFEKACLHVGRAASKRVHAAEEQKLKTAVKVGSSTKVSADRQSILLALAESQKPGSKRKFEECDASDGRLDPVECQHSMRQGYHNLLSQTGIESERTQTDNISLKQENSKMETQNQQLTRSLIEANVKIKKITDEIERIKTRLCEQKASSDAEIAIIKQASTKTKTEKVKLVNELDDAYKQIKESKAEINKFNVSLEESQLSLETWKAKAQTEEITIARLQLFIQQREHENVELSNENARIWKRLKTEANRIAGTMLEPVKRELGLKIEEAEAKAIVAMKEAQEANAKKHATELVSRKYEMWFERMPPLLN